jgi:hypothetical protein
MSPELEKIYMDMLFAAKPLLKKTKQQQEIVLNTFLENFIKRMQIMTDKTVPTVERVKPSPSTEIVVEEPKEEESQNETVS